MRGEGDEGSVDGLEEGRLLAADPTRLRPPVVDKG